MYTFVKIRAATGHRRILNAIRTIVFERDMLHYVCKLAYFDFDDHRLTREAVPRYVHVELSDRTGFYFDGQPEFVLFAEDRPEK